ncbi:MAG: MOSC domain-containing protein [Burkholderiaceae bacterium]
MQVNLRQVHLLHDELLSEMQSKGYAIAPGEMGENITTHGLPILELSEGTLLKLGSEAVIRVTGLRNPCKQIDTFRAGLLTEVVDRAQDGSLIRKAGVMCVVEQSGKVRAGDRITIVSRPKTHIPLQPV